MDCNYYQENLLEVYQQSFRHNWSLPALAEYGSNEVLNYGEFARRIARIHMFYSQIGVRPGDKVAVMGKNSVTWVIVYMATITYGATIVPILADFNPNDAMHIVNHSGSKVLFLSQSIWETFDFDELPGLMAVISLETRKVLAERTEEGKESMERVIRNLTRRFRSKYRDGFTPEDVVYPKVAKDDVAEINYTSGTTGFSKGVMLTFDNLLGNVMFGIRSRLHYEGSRALSFLPLAHAYGCAFDMLVPLATGTFITIFGKAPTPRLLLGALGQVRPNLVICVPLILEKIYRKQIVPMITKRAVRWALALPLIDGAIYSKIRKKLVEAFGGEFEEVIIGGAPLNGEVEEFLHRIKFPFTVGYGMTECGPLISYTPWREFIPSSCGRTLPNMESKVNSPDPEHVPGEIGVRGQDRMKGYYRNPDATELAIDAEGWLHTGDMGTRSADGTLFIKGRYKTMILSATGQNIYPEEIEAKLNNMPYVNESLIVEHIQLTSQEFEKTPKKSIKRFLYS